MASEMDWPIAEDSRSPVGVEMTGVVNGELGGGDDLISSVGLESVSDSSSPENLHLVLISRQHYLLF